ncbi:MAG: helix-turn-helix transcriptional regulator [Clostridia bacterium]
MNTTLGEKIAFLRKQKQYTQDQLAEKMGVTAQSVSKWENDVTSPDISSLPLLAKIFDTTVDDLLGATTIEQIQQSQTLTNKEVKNLMLKIKILSSDGDKVNVQLPYTFIKTATKTGMKIPTISQKLEGVDLEELFQCVEMGMLGKVVDIVSKDGDTIEVWVE